MLDHSEDFFVADSNVLIMNVNNLIRTYRQVRTAKTTNIVNNACITLSIKLIFPSSFFERIIKYIDLKLENIITISSLKSNH